MIELTLGALLVLVLSTAPFCEGNIIQHESIPSIE